jgi:hypothetical protein
LKLSPDSVAHDARIKEQLGNCSNIPIQVSLKLKQHEPIVTNPDQVNGAFASRKYPYLIVAILLDEAVDPSKFNDEISRRGGFEKMLAARSAARNPQKSASKDDGNPSGNEGENEISISCSLALRKRLSAAPIGSTVTLTTTKVGVDVLSVKTLFVAGDSEVDEDDDGAARQSKIIQI